MGLPKGIYDLFMAGQAQPEDLQELTVSPPSTSMMPHPDRAERLVAIKRAAAKLYGQGFDRRHVARTLIDHLVPTKEFPDGVPRPLEQRLSQARNTLAKWEKRQDFRDLIYEQAVVKLDLQTPAILAGVARKAKRGRVDAARLALEITGRHNPKGEVQPAQVAIVFNGVPRPGDAEAVEAIEIADADVMVEPDDEV